MSNKIIDDEELKEILEAIAEAFEKAGKKIQTAIKVTDIEDGKIVGETLIDNREDKEIN